MLARRKTFLHPEIAEITLDCDALAVQGSDLNVVVYTAPAGSHDADSLALLGAIGLQAFSVQRPEIRRRRSLNEPNREAAARRARWRLDRSARPPEEVLDRVGQQLVELLVPDDPARDQRRDALDRGEQDQPYALGVAGLEHAFGLALKDQLEHHRERPVGDLVVGPLLLLVLAREHQLEQSGVLHGEADVGVCGGVKARAEVLAGGADCGAELATQPLEP
jgi:transcription regulator MmyB-like protein